MYIYIHVCGGNRCIYTFVVVADVYMYMYMYLVVVYICIYTFVAVVYMYIHVCSLSNDYYCTIASIVC